MLQCKTFVIQMTPHCIFGVTLLQPKVTNANYAMPPTDNKKVVVLQ